MKMKTKIWLVIAASFLLMGGITFCSVIAMLNWDFTKLSTSNYQTNTYQIGEAFDGISINTDTAHIIFVISDDGKCKVECYEEEKAKHSVAVEEETLVISMIDNKSWYDYIGINFDSPKIIVYLPKTQCTSLIINQSTGKIEIPKDFKFKDVEISSSTADIDFFACVSSLIRIKTSTGDISVEDISADLLDISVSTGKVTVSGVNCEGDVKINVSTGKSNITNIKCKNLISNGNTGDIYLKNVNAVERFTIERSTGDVKFDNSDAAEISVKTETGDVRGTLLSDKVFIVQTDTGSVDIPKTVNGGRCEITTDTGDISIR